MIYLYVALVKTYTSCKYRWTRSWSTQ